jgi:hypothetical protein
MGRYYQKEVIWSYEGVVCAEEREFDRFSEIAEPTKGDLITRKGKTWKVKNVDKQAGTSGEFPILWVYLTDQF